MALDCRRSKDVLRRFRTSGGAMVWTTPAIDQHSGLVNVSTAIRTDWKGRAVRGTTFYS